MHRALGFLLLVAGLGAGPAHAQLIAAEFRNDPIRKWEYRVLSKDQLPKGQAQEIAHALNKLGEEGWELVAAGDVYIFKRPKGPDRFEDIKRQVVFLQAEADTLKDRVAWSKRMARKGFLSDNQLQFEEDLLNEVQTALERAKADLKALDQPAKTQPAKTPRADRKPVK